MFPGRMGAFSRKLLGKKINPKGLKVYDRSGKRLMSKAEEEFELVKMEVKANRTGV